LRTRNRSVCSIALLRVRNRSVSQAPRAQQRPLPAGGVPRRRHAGLRAAAVPVPRRRRRRVRRGGGEEAAAVVAGAAAGAVGAGGGGGRRPGYRPTDGALTSWGGTLTSLARNGQTWFTQDGDRVDCVDCVPDWEVRRMGASRERRERDVRGHQGSASIIWGHQGGARERGVWGRQGV
jgi:hypothetical protein